MTDIAAFIRARLAEDEQIANAAAIKHGVYDNAMWSRSLPLLPAALDWSCTWSNHHAAR